MLPALHVTNERSRSRTRRGRKRGAEARGGAEFRAAPLSARGADAASYRHGQLYTAYFHPSHGLLSEVVPLADAPQTTEHNQPEPLPPSRRDPKRRSIRARRDSLSLSV